MLGLFLSLKSSFGSNACHLNIFCGHKDNINQRKMRNKERDEGNTFLVLCFVGSTKDNPFQIPWSYNMTML